MEDQNFPGDPTVQAVFDALLTANVPPKEAYDATQGIRDMAGANLDANFDSLRHEFSVMRWMIGLGFEGIIAILGAVLALLLD